MSGREPAAAGGLPAPAAVADQFALPAAVGGLLVLAAVPARRGSVFALPAAVGGLLVLVAVAARRGSVFALLDRPGPVEWHDGRAAGIVVPVLAVVAGLGLVSRWPWLVAAGGLLALPDLLGLPADPVLLWAGCAAAGPLVLIGVLAAAGELGRTGAGAAIAGGTAGAILVGSSLTGTDVAPALSAAVGLALAAPALISPNFPHDQDHPPRVDFGRGPHLGAPRGRRCLPRVDLRRGPRLESTRADEAGPLFRRRRMLVVGAAGLAAMPGVVAMPGVDGLLGGADQRYLVVGVAGVLTLIAGAALAALARRDAASGVDRPGAAGVDQPGTGDVDQPGAARVDQLCDAEANADQQDAASTDQQDAADANQQDAASTDQHDAADAGRRSAGAGRRSARGAGRRSAGGASGGGRAGVAVRAAVFVQVGVVGPVLLALAAVQPRPVFGVAAAVAGAAAGALTAACRRRRPVAVGLAAVSAAVALMTRPGLSPAAATAVVALLTATTTAAVGTAARDWSPMPRRFPAATDLELSTSGPATGGPAWIDQVAGKRLALLFGPVAGALVAGGNQVLHAVYRAQDEGVSIEPQVSAALLLAAAVLSARLPNRRTPARRARRGEAAARPASPASR